MKIIRIKNSITVILNSGDMISSDKCTDELYNKVLSLQDNDEEVKILLAPEYGKEIVEAKKVEKVVKAITKSKYLRYEGSSVYFENISELTVPQDLCQAVVAAEEKGDLELIQTYRNFWTLASLNPDSRARTNLFWFLNKYGMTISKRGLFLAYRNVDIKKQGTKSSSSEDKDLTEFISASYVKIKGQKKSPKNFEVIKSSILGVYYAKVGGKYESTEKVLGNLSDLYLGLSAEAPTEVATVYTDNYTHSMEIKIGQVVVMDREKCDSVQENTCSRGLHVASKDWLLKNGSGFGKKSLLVLVNPADVVAVPPRDSYGKMRVCAYYPIQVAETKDGTLIDGSIQDGFQDDFINVITSQDTINNVDDGKYSIKIPIIPELSSSTILSRLEDIKNLPSKNVS